MPVVTITENKKPLYIAVSEATEIRLDSVVSEYKLSDCRSREVVEHNLKMEYLRRLTQHAHDCVTLASLAEHEPDEDSIERCVDVRSKLTRKIAEDSVWLRTYDPFTGLTADVVDPPKGEGNTQLLIPSRSFGAEDEPVSALDDDSWDATEYALRYDSPMWRQRRAEEAAKKAETYETKYSPAERKKIDAANRLLTAAVDSKARREKRAAKTVANKTARRSKRGAK